VNGDDPELEPAVLWLGLSMAAGLLLFIVLLL